jgi:hypothetical protein
MSEKPSIGTPFNLISRRSGNRVGARENKKVERAGSSTRGCDGKLSWISNSRIWRLEPPVEMKAQRLCVNFAEEVSVEA